LLFLHVAAGYDKYGYNKDGYDKNSYHREVS
jgi:hypothetical protein